MGVGDVSGGEAVVTWMQVDPLVADEDCHLALEDVVRLVLVAVDVARSRVAARAGDLDLRERVAGLGAACLDGHPAGLPPDVGETLAGCDAVGLGDWLDGHGTPSVENRCLVTVGMPAPRVSYEVRYAFLGQPDDFLTRRRRARERRASDPPSAPR